MKVLKRNVFIGSKVKCVNIVENKNKSATKSKTYKFSKIETNVIFVQTKEGVLVDCTYVELVELKRCHLPSSLAKKFVQQYKQYPEKVGDLYVTNIQPYYKHQTLKENERVDIYDIAETTKTL